MKKCPKCKEWLSLDSFASRGGAKGANSYCRLCQNEYSKAHYRCHVELHNHRRYVNQKRYRERNTDYVRQYLSNHACVDCGESDVRVLEFDHVGNNKAEDVATLRCQGASSRRIAEEIAKCQVRCANCHRKRTADQFGWWRNVGT
jgi:hypothetical protein